MKNGIYDAMVALHNVLDTTLQYTSAAQLCMSQGQQNRAIGTLAGLDELLKEAASLYNAVCTMHRYQK